MNRNPPSSSADEAHRSGDVTRPKKAKLLQGVLTRSLKARLMRGELTLPKKARPMRASSKAVSKEVERIDSMFHAYTDASSSMIDPEGIEAFCSDLEVHHTDVRILMLAWKMGAERQGYFTLEEWRRGLKALHVDTIRKLKKALPELEKEVARPLNFSNFYSYAFCYCLTDGQKCIDIESACELTDLVLGLHYRPQVTKFVEYLKLQHEYNFINMDQWNSFLEFCMEINFPSLENYDSNLGWPLILDDFVEWMRETQR